MTDHPTAEQPALAHTILVPIVSRDPADHGLPGVWLEVDAQTAEEMGAFEETALSVQDVEDGEDGN